MEDVSQNDIQTWKKTIGDYILGAENISARYIAILAMASVFLDIYNYFSFSFVSFSFLGVFHVQGALFGLTLTAVNIGAAIGTISGGFLTDKYGRRVMFMVNMTVFIIMAIISSLSTNFWEFTISRIILGFSLGADIPTGMAYLFEFLDEERRLKYTFLNWNSGWGFVPVVTVFLIFIISFGTGFTGAGSLLIWRIILGLGAIFALVILLLRSRLPESALWLAHKGNFKKAKETIKSVYGKEFNEIKDIDYSNKRKTGLSETLFGAFKINRLSNRVYVHAFLLSWLVSMVFWGFGFYVPEIITALHFGTTVPQKLALEAGIFSGIIISGIVAAPLNKRLGMKTMTASFSYLVAFIFLLMYLTANHVFPKVLFLPLAFFVLFALMVGAGSFFATLNPVVPPEYRGTINGWAYFINKVAAVIAGLYGAVIYSTLGLSGNSLFMLFMALIIAIIISVVGVNTRKVDVSGLQNETPGVGSGGMK